MTSRLAGNSCLKTLTKIWSERVRGEKFREGVPLSRTPVRLNIFYKGDLGFIKRIYIAYGSNMNIGQMASRCPDFKLLGVSRIEGYALEFHGGGGAAAAIVPREDSRVPVVLWCTCRNRRLYTSSW